MLDILLIEDHLKVLHVSEMKLGEIEDSHFIKEIFYISL